MLQYYGLEHTCAKLIIKAVVEVMDVHGCVGLVHSCDQHSAEESKYRVNTKPINAYSQYSNTKHFTLKEQ